MVIALPDPMLELVKTLSYTVRPLGRRLLIYTHGLLLAGTTADLVPRSIEITSGILEADVVIAGVHEYGEDELLDIINDAGRDALILLSGVIRGIFKRSKLVNKIVKMGFVKSWLPLGEGILAVARRVFDEGFLRKTVRVYRDSFIYGPNPIHYSTAHALYILSKFILARRRGLIVGIGTGRGFSTLWLAQAAMEYGSKVISIDNNCERVEYALRVFSELGLNNCTKLICRDGKEPLDNARDIIILFIDAKKDEYHKYLEAFEDKLTKGAMVIAHNTLSSSHEMVHYINMVYGDKYTSITIATDPAGITISIYKQVS